MDITEALRNEDLSKTDFFDFVTCPEINDPNNRLIRSPGNTASFIVEGLQELKETNNNHLPSTDGFEHILWGASTANNPINNNSVIIDKDTVKLETSIYEDWNKLWGHAVLTPDPNNINNNNRSNNNTDGAIYTLTVLNGEHTTWFNKPDDPNSGGPTTLQHPMDIDSLLSIMTPPSTTNNNTSSNNQIVTTTNGYRNDTSQNTSTSSSPPTTFTYSTGEEQQTNETITLNNDTTTTIVTANDTNSYNSLLRSALQGKASFLSRYNIKLENDAVDESTDDNIVQHTELVASSPVIIDDSTNNSSPNGLFNTTNNTTVLPSMFETHNLDSEPSGHSMEELLLSQLDVTYDYEKLRRIEDEVAESVQQFCTSNGISTNGNIDSNSNPPLYKLVTNDTTNSNSSSTTTTPVVLNVTNTSASTITTTTNTNAKNKKYSKRSKSAAEKTTTVNGIRKERSLHYCNICSKGFKDKYSVNVHIRTHTGEKPFACNLCGKSFRQKAHLAKHYQTHAQKTSLNTNSNHKSTKR